MESYRIRILEKYSLMLKTLPYYSYTHNACLLLSCFSPKSRKNLKDNYKAFLNCMEKNLMQVEIKDENIKRRYSLPCDLFKFRINIESEEQATYFKEWIVNISEGHGFYFESDSFRRINLIYSVIYEDLIEGFIPYIDTMKSIIAHNGENDQSLHDIACVSSYDINNFISNNVNIPNPFTNFCNKINYVRLCEGYSKNIECLEAMKKVPLYVKTISISSNNVEELENLTDPNLHNTPIEKLELVCMKSFEISSKTIENLQSIYPNSIKLRHNFLNFKDESTNQALFGNFTKLLPKLDHTSLVMRLWDIDYSFRLEFRDVIFKVVESKEECSYIRAKSAEIRCIGDELCWIKARDLNKNVLDSYYLYLNKSKYINISEFVRIKDQEEIKEVEKVLSNEALSEINYGIIFPMKYSNKIYFNSLMLDKSKVEVNQKTIEVIPHIKDIRYEWNLRSKYQLISEYLPLLPARTKYTLSMGCLDLKTHPDLDEKLRILNWNDKRIISIECMSLSDENYSFVVVLLEIQKVQQCLNSIKLATRNLTNSLKIMELLRKCKSIDSIELKYSTSDVDNKEEAIIESVQKLINQVGLINMIEITKR